MTSRINFEHLIPKEFNLEISKWFHEDIPSFDIGGFVVGNKPAKAILLGKSSGILAGIPFFTKIFDLLSCEIEWLKTEGSIIEPIEPVAYVNGNTNDILAGERLALNVIQRASGIATHANEMVNLAKKHNYQGKIAGTRKTTPGFRLVEKYALLVAGADTHRMDLSSMVMLKDNHIASAGNIPNAIALARSATSVWYKIEVECQSYQDAQIALESGADIIMLDNFNPISAKETAQKLKAKFPLSIIEISGGVSKSNIIDYFSPYIDIISMSSLITAAKPSDFSLKLIKE